MDDPTQLLKFALDKYPGQVEIAPLSRLVMDSARQNPKRPAYVKLAVPDDVVKALRGRGQERVFLVRIPNEIEQRAESPIVLPGEVR